MAPAKAAIGSSGRPWNSRTPFQIMPQARKVSACGNSGGNCVHRRRRAPERDRRGSDQIGRAPPGERAHIALLQPGKDQQTGPAARRCRPPRTSGSVHPAAIAAGLAAANIELPSTARPAQAGPSVSQSYTAGLWEKPCALARASMQDLRKFELNPRQSGRSGLRERAQKGRRICRLRPWRKSDDVVANDQRLENWNERRALARPYFLRSTTRESRVRKPPRLSAPRKSGS